MRDYLSISLALIIFTSLLGCALSTKSEQIRKNKDKDVPAEGDADPLDEQKLEYAKGSVCNYCEYCVFCKLCDDDCPCQTSATKPNCHMCKYCKFCYLCSALCDTVCKPGGLVDTFSAAIVNSLPSFNKAEIDDDLEGAKRWIDQKREEL